MLPACGEFTAADDLPPAEAVIVECVCVEPPERQSWVQKNAHQFPVKAEGAKREDKG